MFKGNNKENLKSSDIFKGCRRRSGVFIVNFEHISNLFRMFILMTLNRQMMTLNRQMFAGIYQLENVRKCCSGVLYQYH